MTLQKFKNLLLFSGLFNIVFAFPLIIPGIYEYYLELLNNFNFVIGLGGCPVAIPENPLNALFINTAGIDLVLIGAIILVVSRKPMENRMIILLNGIGRLLFALVISYYVVIADIIQIIIVFGLIDVLISIGFLYFLNKTKQL